MGIISMHHSDKREYGDILLIISKLTVSDTTVQFSRHTTIQSYFRIIRSEDKG
jgi:hypothetical protein